MKLPILNDLPKSETSIIEFRGLNKTISASTNELIDCENISLKYYPKIITRPPRKTLYSGLSNPQAIFKSKKLYYVANKKFYADGVFVFDKVGGKGEYIVTENAVGNVAGSNTYKVNVNFKKENAITIDDVTLMAVVEPTVIEPVEGEDPPEPFVLGDKQFIVGDDTTITATNIAAALNLVTEITSIYTVTSELNTITITEKVAGGGNTPEYMSVVGSGRILTGTETESKAADTIEINGIKLTANIEFAVGADIPITTTNIANALNAKTAITNLYTTISSDNTITMTEKIKGGGNTPTIMETTGTIRIDSSNIMRSVPALLPGSKSIVEFWDKICIFPDKVFYNELDGTYGSIGNGVVYPEQGSCPDIDYACVHDNRIFGVKGSTIYGCSLGNMQDWTTFINEEGEPSQTGAYAVDVASPGDFTGCIEYQNHVVAFKEHYHHELYGQKPSNFSTIEIAKIGTINNQSIVEISSALYFLSEQGVMRYGGGASSNISIQLNEKYSNGVIGGDGRFLYLSLYNNFEYNLYTYDTKNGLWWREDGLHVVDFAQDGDTLYCLASDNKVYEFNSGAEVIEWQLTLTDLSEIGKTNKKNTTIYAAIYAEYDTEIEVFISEDRQEFRRVASYRYENSSVKNIPVSINAVSELKIKIKGNKYAEVYSVQKKVVGGGTVWR